MRLLFDQGTLVLVEPAEFDRARVPGLMWDRRVGLFRAPAWRYPEVLAALQRVLPAMTDEVRPSGLPSTSGWHPMEAGLRPYQRAALLSWELAGRRGTIVLPTGSGKTQVAMAAMASSAVRTLCLVPTRALLQQWATGLRGVYGGSIGCLGDGRREVAALTLATFESAHRFMGRIGAQFDLLVVDEAHHFGSSVRDEALEMSIAPQRLGLTATPPGEPARTRLEDLLGPIVYQLGIQDLSGTWLADFDVLAVHLGLDADERARYDADRKLFRDVNRRFRRFDPGASWQDFVSAAGLSPESRAGLAAWRRNRKLLQFTRAKARAVATLLKRHRDSRVLVFTADNEAAYAIAREHLIMPITCDVSRREREAALADFRNGALKALVSARVLNEGIDVPDADVAIVVAGTQGQREHVQRVGRLLRPVRGKRALIYELVTLGTSECFRAMERRRALAPAVTASG